MPDETPSELPIVTQFFDLRFNGCHPYEHDAGEILNAINTTALRTPIRAFLVNIHRLRSLSEMPAELSWFSFANKSLEEKMRLAEDQSQAISGYGDFRMQFFQLLQGTREEHEMSQTILDEGKGALQFLISGTAPHFFSALHAVLTSQIIGAWTAFEVLAGDLWGTALNTHPGTLATLDGKMIAKEKRRDPEQVAMIDERDLKSISISKIADSHFNVSNRMGTILHGKFNFTILTEIRNA